MASIIFQDFESEEKEEAVKWYAKERPLYEALAKKLEDDIHNMIKAENLRHYEVQSRAKSIDSFKEKIEECSNFVPKKMQDLSAARVIVNGKLDKKKIFNIIEKNFTVNRKLSSDIAERLKTNKVGYRSFHYIVKYPRERVQLTEYKRFDGIEFEIQIRTIFEHAWAEISHEKNYKISENLPPEILRQLNLLAGSLELIDDQFEQLSKNIDDYEKEVSTKTKAGELSIPIDTISLKQYMDEEYGSIDSGSKNFVSLNVTDELMLELKTMDIKTLEDLDNITKKDFKKKLSQYGTGFNYTATVRAILFIHDPKKYLSTGRHGHWTISSTAFNNLMKEYGLDLEKLYKKYEIKLPE